MKVQQLTPQFNKKYNKNNQPNNSQEFTGLGDIATSVLNGSTAVLRFLDTNQAIGANCVDLGSMVIPRTAYDMKNRGPNVGWETARREASGTTNHSLVGVYGVLGGMLVSTFVNSKYPGIKANNVFADNLTTEILAKNWHNAIHSKQADPLKTYLNDVISQVKMYNPQIDSQTGWASIPKDAKDKVVEKLYDLIKNNKSDKIDNKSVEYIKSLITSATGSEHVMLKMNEKSSESSLQALIENIHNLSKLFTKDNVKEVFENTEDFASNTFVKSMKSMNSSRTLIGVGLATAIGMSIQPINKYLTFKKTGQRGFVGVPGREEDTSTGFKILKGIVGAVFGLFALSTITRNPKKLMSKLQFKGMLPTLDQLKCVYGLTIMSRFFAARDKDELRESVFKDTLGFLNLLILGSLVTKGVARIFNKSKSLFHEMPYGKKGSGFIGSKLKTRDEVLLSTLHSNGISTVKDGKALKFTELLKLKKKLPVAIRKQLNKEMGLLTVSQIVGYLYSGLVLGLAVPALNNKMTAKSTAKFQTKYEAEHPELFEQAKEENVEEQTPAKKTTFGNDFVIASAQKNDFAQKYM